MSFPRQEVTPFGSGFDRLAIGIGDEGHLIELAALVQIKANLDTEIDRQEAFWKQRQTDFFTAMNLASRPIEVERVDPRNYFHGARPSLLQAPIDFWPSITARCGDARPSRQQYDTTDQYDLDLYIEVMCKTGPISPELLHEQQGIDAEGDVNAQTHLLSSAVQMCIHKDRSLGGIALSIQNPPTIRPSMPFAIAGVNRERTGDYFIYMGRQLRFVINRLSY